MSELFELLLHADTYLLQLAADYGVWIYAILFAIIFAETGLVVTPFLPGDSLLFAAGAIAATGALDVRLLAIVVAVAAVAGNAVNYSIGRMAGHRVIHLAQTGRRNVIHAFNLAGRALGYGLSRLMTVAAPAHVVVTGPGAGAFELMRAEIEWALRDSLVCRINGTPSLTVHHDEREPIFQGMLRNVLDALDRMTIDSLAVDNTLTSVR